MGRWFLADFAVLAQVDERREQLVQVTLKNERDEVDAINKFRASKKNKDTKDKGSEMTQTDTSTTTQSNGESKLHEKLRLYDRRRNRRGRHPEKLSLRGGLLTKIHVASAAASQSVNESPEAPLDHSDAMKRALQERLDEAGVWVKAGPGKWEPQRREAPYSSSSSATPQTAAAADLTQVVAFDVSLSDAGKCTRDLLKSDVHWKAFLKTVNSELGHETDATLHVEDLE